MATSSTLMTWVPLPSCNLYVREQDAAVIATEVHATQAGRSEGKSVTDSTANVAQQHTQQAKHEQPLPAVGCFSFIGGGGSRRSGMSWNDFSGSTKAKG